MRIAYDVTPACEAQPTGIVRYVDRLGDALRRRPGVELRPVARLSRWRDRGNLVRGGWDPAWYYEPLLRPWRRYDLVHGTAVRVPSWSGCLRVATVHDVFHLLPRAAAWSSPAFAARSRERYARMCAVADLIVCVSAATRDDLLAHLPYPAERTAVVHLGIDPRFAAPDPAAVAEVRRRLGLQRDYVLFVGNLAVRKNVPNQVRGWAAAAAARSTDFVLAGSGGEDDAAIAAVARDLPPGATLRRLDYVADADLPALYGGAAAACFATRYEGFGLPIIEAMACGVPVVAGNVGAAPEVAGGFAAIAEPEDPAAIAAAIDAALAMPAERRAAAATWARAFTWERCADATLAAYARAMALGRKA